MAQPEERRRPGAEELAKDKPLVKELNEHIVCPLCRGYFIDATTLVECLHSFCRGCIVRHLHKGPKTCPVCKVSSLVPLTPDVGLQRLVYLIVPGLYRAELERRKSFYQANPQCTNSNQPPIGAPDLSFDELVSLSLCELDSESDASTRYLKCPGGVSVRHLIRLLMLKRGWDGAEGDAQQCGNNKIEMMYEIADPAGDTRLEPLDPSWTLVDLSCIFEWKREAPMKLVYRISRVDEPINDLVSISFTSTNVTDISNQTVENIQRPPTPPPSPKPAIPRIDSLKSPRPTSQTTSMVDQYAKDHELKKPRCEVTPVMRAPDPPPPIKISTKPGKLAKLEHKRKKRRNKRVIAEITTTPREDLLKLKVRLTPCPPRVSSSVGSPKDKLVHVKTKEKTKDSSQKHRLPKVTIPVVKEEKKLPVEKEPIGQGTSEHASEKVSKKVEVVKVTSPVPTKDTPDQAQEAPKNEEVLRRLGLVAISEANKSKQENAKSGTEPGAGKSDPAMEREKLEKQLRESKANRVRSLLAEKQMRDTLKSIMSKETSPGSSSSSSSTRSATPTSLKRKDPPPLTPLRSAKRPNVTFAPSSFTPSKFESPLDLSSPASKDNVLDLSSSLDGNVGKTKSEEKPVGILRNSTSRSPAEKQKEETKKSQDTNLRTLSDAAVSLLSTRTGINVEKLPKMPQSFPVNPGVVASSPANKVALRIPQPQQRLAGFGMKIKPNIGVRHIPNPQAVVASQYRNQRTGFFSLAQQPP